MYYNIGIKVKNLYRDTLTLPGYMCLLRELSFDSWHMYERKSRTKMNRAVDSVPVCREGQIWMSG